MGGRGGIFGFSILEIFTVFILIKYNRLIFRFLNASVMGYEINKDPKNEVAKKTEAEVNQIPVNKEKLTKGNKVAYNEIAQTLYNAMYGVGTDFATMEKVLAPLNAEDLKQVYKAFRHRDYSFLGVEKIERATLFQWFNAELSESQMSKMGEIWESTGLWPY